MSLAVLAAGVVTRGALRSGSAVSVEGQFARAQVTEVWNNLDNSISLQGPHAILFDELDALVIEHSLPGWDGEAAPAIAYETAQNARDLIKILPASLPTPELAIDPDDAAISFEWHGGFRKVFSLSIGTSRRLACAGLNGTDRWHAAFNFDGGRLPALVLESIRQTVT